MAKVAGIMALVALTAAGWAPSPAAACPPSSFAKPPPPTAACPAPTAACPAPVYVPPPAPVVVLPHRPGCTRVRVRVPCRRPRLRGGYRYRCPVRRPPPPRRYVRRDPWPYHPKSTPYLGVGGGFLSLIRPSGGFEHLQPRGHGSAFFGWNFGGWFALELGLAGSFFRPSEALGNVDRVGLAAITLDARLRLIRPSPHNPVVPFLQSGLGVYTLAGRFPDSCNCRTRTMAHGGGVQAGGGLDFYLNRYAILGVRVLYRHLFMSQLIADGNRVTDSERLTRLHAVSAGLTFTMFWSHL